MNSLRLFKKISEEILENKLGCERLEGERAYVWYKENNLFYLNTRQTKENNVEDYMWYGPRIEIVEKYRILCKKNKWNFFMVFGTYLAHTQNNNIHAFCIPIETLEEDSL